MEQRISDGVETVNTMTGQHREERGSRMAVR